jgi:uncharacterized protein (TIGR02217 family)
MAVRVSQDVIASLSIANLAHTRVTQIVIDVMGQGGGVRVSQAALDVLTEAEPRPRVSQLALTVLSQAVGVRTTQFVISILVWNHEVLMPAIYPTLPGLTYSVIKRPKFYTGIGQSASGREVRVAYAANPLWEWDLTYNYLPDEQTGSSATPSDLQQILGFYLSQSGAFGGFLFQDPDDNAVTEQAIGTTDGTTTIWTLVRTYGGSDGTGTEPIGYVNSGVTFNLYLNGALQSGSTYDVLDTIPVNQQIRFHSAPTTGQAITASFGYYYYCRFQDDHYEFEKFYDKLWSLAKVTLMSLRG